MHKDTFLESAQRDFSADMTKLLIFASLCLSLWLTVHGSPMVRPKTLSVSCKTLGASEEFRRRLKWRENAEDHTTIWLFKGEQLNIRFELEENADVEVLGVVYSNDGHSDLLGLNLDGREIGRFNTISWHGWGYRWNKFESSGPVGGIQSLEKGKHVYSLKILEADLYGIEIDYIRLNVLGGKTIRLNKDNFLCIHEPGKGYTNYLPHFSKRN